MSEPETLEQIAHRIAERHAMGTRGGKAERLLMTDVCTAMREVEEEFDLRAREQQELAGIYKQRFEKAEAEVERLRNELTATQVRANEIARLKNPKP